MICCCTCMYIAPQPNQKPTLHLWLEAIFARYPKTTPHLEESFFHVLGNRLLCELRKFRILVLWRPLTLWRLFSCFRGTSYFISASFSDARPNISAWENSSARSRKGRCHCMSPSRRNVPRSGCSLISRHFSIL